MSEEKKSHYKAYESNLRDLRHWLLAYGVGGPLLLLSNADLYEKLAQSPDSRSIVIAFSFGVAFQVGITLINKWNNWFLYGFCDLNGEYKKGFPSNFCNWFGKQVWLDIFADVLSVGTFGYATIKALQILI